MKSETLTTHMVAAVCDVHHTTVINWVKEGKLKAYTTPGGHRRILKDDLRDFVRKYKIPTKDDCLNRQRVLIVDDDSEALDELKELLSILDVDIDLASDGFEAGRKIYSQRPSLILLDFRMPRMDGFEVCKVLKEDSKTQSIPIIAITALRNREDEQRIMKCGVSEYLPKPLDMDRLLVLVKQYLLIE
jgi:excisionase family DNA binding protein